jgi:hypothetical protein
MMEVANNSNIPDQLRVVHQPSQKLIAVVCLEGLLLQHLGLFGSDGGNDGHLHVTEASVIGQQQYVQNVLDVGSRLQVEPCRAQSVQQQPVW